MKNFYALCLLLLPICLFGQINIKDIPTTSANKPTVHWLTLKDFVENTEQSSITLQANIASTTRVNTKIYVNDKAISNADITLKKVKRNNYFLEAEIDLEKGKNEIELRVTNNAGTIREHPRTVNYIKSEPPTFKWKTPKKETTNADNQQFDFELKIASAKEITYYDVHLNGQKVERKKETSIKKEKHAKIITGTVKLTKYVNILTAKATNANGLGEAEIRKVIWKKYIENGYTKKKNDKEWDKEDKEEKKEIPPSLTPLPIVTIITPRDFTTTDNPNIEINYAVTDIGNNLDEIEVWQNESLIEQNTKGFKKIKRGGEQSQRFSQKINLSKGKNVIKVIADTNNQESSEAEISIYYKPQKTTYYALIIAVQDYTDPTIKDLDFPLKDASKLQGILTRKYLFEKRNVKLLNNPSSDEIKLAFINLKKKLTTNDNLLIFYSGHGGFDKDIDLGYWYPSDTDLENELELIENSTIQNYIAGMKAKHCLLISDACFSGSILKDDRSIDDTRNIDAKDKCTKYMEAESRCAMTSGYLEEVPDNSKFFEQLYHYLEINEESCLLASELFARLQIIVSNKTDAKPQYGEIKKTGHNGGQFVFKKR